MGAAFQRMTVPGDRSVAEVREAFEREQDQDRYENGHSYSGGFGMASGLTFETRPVFESLEAAEEWLQEHCRKWEDALCVKAKDGDATVNVIGAWCSS